jgi:hypothetical protein
MLELGANDPIIKNYLAELQHLKAQGIDYELGLKAPFHTLLDKAARRVPEFGRRREESRRGTPGACATGTCGLTGVGATCAPMR